MERIYWIAGFSAVTVGVAATVAGALVKRRKWLDVVYHNALHAESQGAYVEAIELYQSILDRSKGNPLIDSGTRAQILQRINTIRYQQEYLSQFGEDKSLPSGNAVSGVVPSL